MEHPFLTRLREAELVAPYGYVTAIASTHVRATGPACVLGDLCELDDYDGDWRVLAQVAAIDGAGLTLMPLEHGNAIRLGAKVRGRCGGAHVGVGEAYAGRAIDAVGRPLDGGEPIKPDRFVQPGGTLLATLHRATPTRLLPTGVRAIDGLLTLGWGQRIGIFAASGVGKTSLIEQIAAQAACDHCILCLVGERGREVEGMWRTMSERADALPVTLIAATSDESPSLRARAVDTALCLAEAWRDQGRDVLLIIDSATRYAMALREIGLAAGEPPTVRAYTPGVFAALPRIVERCGASAAGGSITAIMTVLSETDDVDDPIVEAMKSLLDGHIVLSRTLAERGHFPAIDVGRSISRLADRFMATEHGAAARNAVAALGIYDEARILIESGMYKSGASREVDQAIGCRDRLLGWLRQGRDEQAGFADTVAGLRAAVRAA
ncbi:FliI/YscN family ATPase [Sphingomonas sp. BT-65]|uniref:FliI/YscN family ATPase n=1 Tax=Sphingomonas sp. BT-65 TaxID=2989821 RepID=UPI00223591AF|nr:FliI/YscN family ATPase [Sphingomonas sp. BT-65]MCW4463797.1 FliI/YscN family ATPase [Sphingomonas sp. BT-65]